MRATAEEWLGSLQVFSLLPVWLNLTDGQAAIPRPYDEVVRDVISVLTEASRLTNQPMRQTSSGQWEADPDPRAAQRIDWAAFVTEALAGAAANAGGIDTILAGRSGSWEASVVGVAWSE